MNLELGILWIEDSYSSQEEDELRRRVNDAGFIPWIDVIPNSVGLETRARNHQLFHKYDLILLDFHLKDESGAELAPMVRSHFPSTTILFYSGSVGEQDLRHLMAEREVEGVYCSARQRFIERAGELIDQTAHSLDRLSGMRGLSMKVVAECDETLKSAVIAMSAQHTKCAEKLVDLDNSVMASLESSRRAYESALAGDIATRIETRAVDSAKLFGHFRRLVKVVISNRADFGLNDDQLERLRELQSSSARYVDHVLNKRNTLGHVSEIEGENGWILQGSGDIIPSDFAELRRTFAIYIETFREMRELVTLLHDQKSN